MCSFFWLNMSLWIDELVHAHVTTAVLFDGQSWQPPLFADGCFFESMCCIADHTLCIAIPLCSMCVCACVHCNRIWRPFSVHTVCISGVRNID